MNKLNWICQHPTPYNDYLFRSLASESQIDLTVHFVKDILPTHPWKSKMAYGFKSRAYKPLFGLDWRLLRTAFSNDCFFIIGGWNEPTIISLINLLMANRKPFALWTDTPNLKAKRNPFKAWLRQRWLEKVFNRSFRIFGTGRLALEVLKEMKCPEDKLVDLPYYVDLNTFVPPHRQPPSDCLIFLSVGRLVNDHKGYDLAVKALGEVKKLRPDLKFIYKIAGHGKDEDQLKRLAEEAGLKDEVQFQGWVEPNELVEFYSSGHVFLHPSHFDPFGVSVLEAMACGLIVIGSDQTGSVIDRVSDSVNGFIHRANDVGSLTKKVMFVLSNYGSLGKLKEASRRAAEEWPVQRGISTILGVLTQRN